MPIFAIVSVHQLLNHLLPARLGEVSFPLLLNRHTGYSRIGALSLLLVVRLQELLTLAVLFVCVLPTLLARNDHGGLWLLGGLGLTVIVLLLVMNACLPMVLGYGARLITVLARRFPFGHRLANRLVEAVEMLKSELMQRPPLSQRLLLLALTLGIWLTTFLLSYTAMHLSGIEVSYSQTIVGSSMSSLSNILPLNSIGSFGSLEAGWTFGFSLVGVPVRQALATGFVLHVIGLFFLGLAGLPSWLWLERRHRP